jgi:hypothetical protein
MIHKPDSEALFSPLDKTLDAHRITIPMTRPRTSPMINET